MSLLPDRWGSTWMSRQQILTRLARYFHVVWMNPAVGWRQMAQYRTFRQQDLGVVDPAMPGFSVYQPEMWLPLLGRPRFLAQFTARQRLQRAYRSLLQRGCQKIVLLLWRPEQGPALDLIAHDLSCYYINDEYTFSAIEQPIEDGERQLISRTAQVFIHSAALWEKKGGLNPHTLLVPNGADYCAYATPTDEPADLKQIPRPRVGYVGRIKQQLDLALLATLAQQHQEWSFVLVGPQESIGEDALWIERLARMPNVYFLGNKPVDTLPSYTQHLDVCLLCYKINGYTKFIYPLKLHEYLASGRPVVGSPIRSLLEFSDVIALARTVEEWSEAMTISLASQASAPTQIEARQRVARQYDWETLVRRIVRTLCDRLGPSYREQIENVFSGTLDTVEP